MVKKAFVLSLALILLIVTGCTRQISQNVYKGSDVGAPASTYRGVIVSARQVTVEEGDKLSDNTMGIAGGALAGGLIGSQFGGGSTAPLVGAGLGAVAGGVGGAFLEKHLTTQDAMEYTVQIDGTGNLMTIVQGVDTVYSVGQRVLVMVYTQGRSRIVADQSQPAPAQYQPAPQAQQPQIVYVQAPQPQQPVYVQAPQPK